MIRYIEKAEKMTLQLIALRGIAVYPSIPQSIEISDKIAKKCIMFAFQSLWKLISPKSMGYKSHPKHFLKSLIPLNLSFKGKYGYAPPIST